jgi:hypothetical protein
MRISTLTVLPVLLLCLSLSQASRTLQQAAAPAAGPVTTAVGASAVTAGGPSAGLAQAAGAPPDLPAAVVSFAAKKNSNQAAAEQALQQAQATPVSSNPMQRRKAWCRLIPRPFRRSLVYVSSFVVPLGISTIPDYAKALLHQGRNRIPRSSCMCTSV